MARRKKPEITEGEGEESGGEPIVSNRAQTIREACVELDEFDRQIAGLKAEVKAIIETRIVAGLGMKKADFALARKLYALDQQDRDDTLDAIRECFAALGLGEQVNFMDVMEREPADA